MQWNRRTRRQSPIMIVEEGMFRLLHQNSHKVEHLGPNACSSDEGKLAQTLLQLLRGTSCFH